MRRLVLLSIFMSVVTMGCFLIRNSAEAGGGPGHYEITTSSGVPHKAGKHRPSSFQGNPSPFSLKITKPPKHGSVRIQQSAGVSSVIYQSKSGYTGRDDFAYVRVGSDRFAGTYTVGVTVK